MQMDAALSPKVWFDEAVLQEVVSVDKITYHLREMREDRRYSARHKVREGTYAVIEPIYPQICQILNIGAGGLSLIYFKNEDTVDFKLGKLDIVVIGEGFCLENVLFEKVDDYKTGERDACGFEKHVAHVRFLDPDEETSSRIRKFIENYNCKTIN